MLVYRLARSKYPIALSGIGAAMSGNRWNSKGTEIVYCAESRALAVAEVAVHLTLATLPKDYVMLQIEIPKELNQQVIDVDDLPTAWNIFPHSPFTQRIGDRFIRERLAPVLKVPSAVVPGDYNYLLHPFHPDFKAIEIVGTSAFPLDERLFS
ncbi:MAG: RES family NAD+ phosphorylase [Salibacteraceae bacterium]